MRHGLASLVLCLLLCGCSLPLRTAVEGADENAKANGRLLNIRIERWGEVRFSGLLALRPEGQGLYYALLDATGWRGTANIACSMLKARCRIRDWMASLPRCWPGPIFRNRQPCLVPGRGCIRSAVNREPTVAGKSTARLVPCGSGRLAQRPGKVRETRRLSTASPGLVSGFFSKRQNFPGRGLMDRFGFVG
jgi:hypothetical protein